MGPTGGDGAILGPVTASSPSEVESLASSGIPCGLSGPASRRNFQPQPNKGRRERLRRSVTRPVRRARCALIFLSLMTVWVHQTVLDTDGFVAAVGPVIDRPNVTQAMSVELTAQIFESIDVERQVKQVLLSQGQFLAAPLTSAAQNFVQGQVRNVLRSSQSASAFTVLRAAHKEVLAALRGQEQRAQRDQWDSSAQHSATGERRPTASPITGVRVIRATCHDPSGNER